MKKIILIATLVLSQSLFAAEVVTISDMGQGLFSFQATDPATKELVLSQVQDCFRPYDTRPEQESVNLGTSCKARVYKIITNDGYRQFQGCGIFSKF